jgi:hypothetical protein
MKPIARVALPVLLFAAGAFAAENGSQLPKSSPFLTAAGASGPAAAANETIEFSGVSTMSQKTDLIFKNKSSNKSSWIAKGETKDGISVLNYDADKEQAVIKVNGIEKVLSLRRASTASAKVKPVAPLPTGFNVATPAWTGSTPLALTVVPATVPAPSTAPATPQTEVQKQETEARMLVSDLLEIGMAQRKAYEEAQRKAAESGGTPPAEAPAKQP